MSCCLNSSCRCSSCICARADAQPGVSRPSKCRSGSPRRSPTFSSPHSCTTDRPELAICNSNRNPKPKGTACHSMAVPQEDISSSTVVDWAEGRFLTRTLLPAQVLCWDRWAADKLIKSLFSEKTYIKFPFSISFCSSSSQNISAKRKKSPELKLPQEPQY